MSRGYLNGELVDYTPLREVAWRYDDLGWITEVGLLENGARVAVVQFPVMPHPDIELECWPELIPLGVL